MLETWAWRLVMCQPIWWLSRREIAKWICCGLCGGIFGLKSFIEFLPRKKSMQSQVHQYHNTFGWPPLPEVCLHKIWTEKSNWNTTLVSTYSGYPILFLLLSFLFIEMHVWTRMKLKSWRYHTHKDSFKTHYRGNTVIGCEPNYTNPGYGLSLVDTLWNAGSYRQPLEQEGNPMT